jgi:hypothetical protein
MGELNRGERLQIMLTHDELRIVDTWRFAKRMPSRAAAIRELLKRGKPRTVRSRRISPSFRIRRPSSRRWRGQRMQGRATPEIS